MNLLASFNDHGNYLKGFQEFVVVAGSWSVAAVLDLLALGFAFFPARRRAARIACIVAIIFAAICVRRQWLAGLGNFDVGDRMIGAAPGGLALLLLLVLLFLPARPGSSGEQ